ncbi:MAG: hypothetical protein K2I86_02590 [Prevotella sp.]|nr:hypothetical protein [Prevotella sp.]
MNTTNIKEQESPIIVKLANGVTVIRGEMQDGNFIAVSQEDSNNIAFAGVGSETVINRMMGLDMDNLMELLVRAVNNRTRQRNYFRLYGQMLEKEISEEDFYQKIEENEDDYVIEELEKPSKERLLQALHLSRKIKNVNSSEDLSDLFSFDSFETDRQLINIEEYVCVQ